MLFLALNALVRIGLALFNQDASLFYPWRLVPALAIGMLFDLCVGLIGLAPIAWLYALWPTRGRPTSRGLRPVTGLLLVPLAGVASFVALSEFTFWNEFASRFNFIAVDYLIYTNEVIGNIRESYNLPVLLGAVGTGTVLLWGLAWRWGLAPLRDPGERFSRRWRPALMLGLIAPLVLVVSCQARFKEFSENGQLNELAGNGYFDFWHAFRYNEIDYERYYKTLPRERAVARLTAEMAGGAPGAVAARPYDRPIDNGNQPSRRNVVLVSIESLSASFMGSFGNTEQLTPNLDRLAGEGLLFTRLYATGTRTVRGLEALSLSVPPTPGHSIVKRPDNAGLFTLGEVFRQQGHEPIYLYGGYGYFDNMSAFFGGNGYTVIDRTALRPEQIHFENIWGVADEDLFSLTLRELDARHAKGKRFYAHVMTTSNHRPFTYPEGRIDIPSKTSREGGVKYTDHAIGEFVKQARQRPWFDQTLFVFVADHTHKGRGRQELPLDAYHIPMIVYAPGHVAPGRVDTIASQIDVAPTLLGMLGISYRSRFFGHDILRDGPANPRALMANYQTVGYYANGRIVELRPNGRSRIVDAQSGQPLPADETGEQMLETAISYYQMASEAYRRGFLKLP
ncbi:MAG: sulfatase-like hydrolase/transferase [Burkholderiales bacterium]|nr:sulfatase-like hydrolase/transferase [Burkholderiales bacterium]